MLIQVMRLEETNIDDDTLYHLAKEVWPQAWFHNEVADTHWDVMWKKHRNCQFVCFVDGTLAAAFYSVPVKCDSYSILLSDLSERGWEWAIETSVVSSMEDCVISALSMSILSQYRSLGLSKIILEYAKGWFAKNNIDFLIAPVRPFKKHLYPLIPMDQYINWKDELGRVFDPWLRVHTNMGAKIIKPCLESMIIKGTAKEWEEWSGIKIAGKGDHIIPYALVPIRFELAGEELIGRYVEPNVWVAHPLRKR